MAGVDLKSKLISAPKVTSVTVTQDKKAELKWSKVPLAEKYDIKRCPTSNGEFVHIDWATDTSFTDAGIVPDTTYWYKVVAWKRMEGKKTSQKASAVTPFIVSDIPCVKNLSAAVTDGKIRLTWDKSEGDKFYIYRKCEHVTMMFFVGESKTNSFLDKTAISGQAYHYCVQTVRMKDGKELHGNFSADVAGVFVDTTEITSAKSAFGNRVVLETRVVAGADGYIFERSDKKDGEFTEVGRTGSITDIGFEEKVPSRLKAYYYRACAYKKVGAKECRGGYSSVKTVR